MRRRDISVKAGILGRVSGDGQETENQIRILREMAARRGVEVARVYALEESAWRNPATVVLSDVFHDAERGVFTILLVWALDRLTRGGPLETLEVMQRFEQRYGVQVWSHQEPWTEMQGSARDLLIAVSGWVAKQESDRRSERVRAGLQRAQENGGGRRGQDKKRRKSRKAADARRVLARSG